MLSSVQGISKGKLETFGYDIWNRMYPSEPFELDLSSCSRYLFAENLLGAPKNTMYDLVLSVKS